AALLTLMTTRMLGRGFLAGGTCSLTLAHEAHHVERYLDALGPVFAELANAIAAGDVTPRLGGPGKHSPFARRPGAVGRGFFFGLFFVSPCLSGAPLSLITWPSGPTETVTCPFEVATTTSAYALGSNFHSARTALPSPAFSAMAIASARPITFASPLSLA